MAGTIGKSGDTKSPPGQAQLQGKAEKTKANRGATAESRKKAEVSTVKAFGREYNRTNVERRTATAQEKLEQIARTTAAPKGATIARPASTRTVKDLAAQASARAISSQSSTSDVAQRRAVLASIQASRPQEVMRKGKRLTTIAAQYSALAASDFLRLDAAGTLAPAQQARVRASFDEMTAKTAAHFRSGKLTGLGAKTADNAAMAQHVGHLTSRLCTQFPDLNQQQVRASLTRYFETPGATADALAAELALAAGNNPAVLSYTANVNNMRALTSFGDIDRALNLPGVYAGEATVEFAKALSGGSLAKTRLLLQSTFDRSPAELQRLLEHPLGEQGLLAQFAARASHASWLVSKLGQGYVEAVAGQGEKAVTRWGGKNELVASFNDVAARRGWVETAKDLQQTKSFLLHRFGDHYSAPRSSRGTHFVTDLEGRNDRLQQLIAAGKLRRSGNTLDFVHPNDPHERLVFGGDLVDRGVNSIEVTEQLVDLKRRYPQRVTLLWGNRDLNKIGMLHDLPLLEKKVSGDFERWVEVKLAASATGANTATGTRRRAKLLAQMNSLEHRVDYWLESHSAPGALELHRKELSARAGHEVSAREAAQDYVDRIRPGGTFFEYLRLGQLMHVDRNAVFVHGGITDENFGRVPGRTERANNVFEWERQLNAWGHAELVQVEHAVKSQGLGKHVPQKIVDYGDAIWDPTAVAGANKRGVVFMNDFSVIYAARQREDGNFRVPQQATIEWLKRSGVDTVMLGHSPVGDVPTPLKADGFLQVMGDTSYGGARAGSTITLGADGGVWVSGHTTQGGAVTYRAAAKRSPYVGMVTEGGYTVVGRTRINGTTQYLLTKYYDGYKIAEKQVTRTELQALKPRQASLAVSQELVKQRDVLLQSLSEKGKRILELPEVANNVIGDKVPIVISGASRFGQYPAAPEVVEAEVRALVRTLDQTRVVLITGGTDNGVEKIVHQVAKEFNVRVVGFIHEGAVPGEINLVRDVVLAGARNQWVDPLLAALELAKRKSGMAVFVGGGGVVKEGIAAADQLGVNYYLMQKANGVEGTGGASGEAAALHPHRAFDSAASLAVLAQHDNVAVFKVAAQQPASSILDTRRSAPTSHVTSTSSVPTVKRVGVFLGSFNPPHAGHKAIVDRMKQEFGLDRVYVVPDHSTEYKQMQRLEDRNAMVAKAFANDPHVRLLDREMEQSIGKGEMWDVLRAVQRRHAGAEVFNIMGTDTFAWYQQLPAEQRTPGVSFLVNDRHEGVSLPDSFDGKPVRAVRDLDRGLSSTKVRAQIKEGVTPAELDPSVWSYIQERGLYR